MTELLLSIALGGLTGATIGGFFLWVGIRVVKMEDQTFKKAFWTNIKVCIFSFIFMFLATPLTLFIGFFQFALLFMINFIVYLLVIVKSYNAPLWKSFVSTIVSIVCSWSFAGLLIFFVIKLI